MSRKAAEPHFEDGGIYRMRWWTWYDYETRGLAAASSPSSSTSSVWTGPSPWPGCKTRGLLGGRGWPWRAPGASEAGGRDRGVPGNSDQTLENRSTGRTGPSFSPAQGLETRFSSRAGSNRLDARRADSRRPGAPGVALDGPASPVAARQHRRGHAPGFPFRQAAALQIGGVLPHPAGRCARRTPRSPTSSQAPACPVWRRWRFGS